MRELASFGRIAVAYGPVMSSSFSLHGGHRFSSKAQAALKQVKIMMSHDPEGHLVIHIFFLAKLKP